MLNSLKTTIDQTLANQLRILLGSSICIIYSKGEKSIYSSLLKLSCNQEIVSLSVCKDLEHKGRGSQCVFKGCKEFTKIVENLKWVTWELDVGTESDRTSINWVCNSLILYLIYFITTDFILHVLKEHYYINCCFFFYILNWFYII